MGISVENFLKMVARTQGKATRTPVAPAAPHRRIRQSTAPVMNKLESRFAMHLNALNPGVRIVAQGMRVQIANGAWFKVDFYMPALKIAHEVKGPRVMKNQQSRQLLALKVAAKEWPEIQWFLNWYEGGEWFQQEVLP